MRVDRRTPLLLVAAALCLLLGACTIPGTPQQTQNSPVQSSAPPQTPTDPPTTPTPSPSPTPECSFTLQEGSDAKVEIGGNGNFEQLQQDIRKAERFTDSFWQRHWDQCFASVSIRPPEKRNVYSGDDKGKCDGTTMDTDNAFYCPDGHFVAYGRELVERAQNDDVGTQWVYLIVAHEWAHAMQQLLADGGFGELVPNPLDGRHELQADCLAGAALWASDYEGYLEWSDDDSVQVAEDLLKISDETPWTKVTPDGEVRTGGALARVAAFQAGLSVDGVKTCFAAYR